MVFNIFYFLREHYAHLNLPEVVQPMHVVIRQEAQVWNSDLHAAQNKVYMCDDLEQGFAGNEYLELKD